MIAVSSGPLTLPVNILILWLTNAVEISIISFVPKIERVLGQNRPRAEIQ
jgi:hypothetical protein